MRRRGDPTAFEAVLERIEDGTTQAERPVEVFQQKRIERLPRHAFDEKSEQHEPQVAVVAVGPDVVLEGQTGDELVRFGLRSGIVIERYPLTQSGSVHEQMANGDALLSTSGEFREIRPNQRIRLDHAPIDEDHDGERGREHLGQRRHVEKVFGRHGIGRIVRHHAVFVALGEPIRAAVQDLPCARHVYDRAGDVLLVDIALQEGIQGRDRDRLGLEPPERADRDQQKECASRPPQGDLPQTTSTAAPARAFSRLRFVDDRSALRELHEHVLRGDPHWK